MREESHLEDMRSAIRGDFERLAERLGGQELMRSSENVAEQAREHESDEASEPEAVAPEPEIAADDEPVPAPSSESTEVAAAGTMVDETAPSEGPMPEAEPAPLEPDEIEAPRSFLDRLLGR